MILLPRLPVWAAEDTIVIASKSFPESRLLAEVMAKLIEAKTDLQVDRKYGLGGTKICFNGIVTGEVDIYAEYTGTGLVTLLGEMQSVARLVPEGRW